MIKDIHHVGLVVRNLKETIETLAAVFGFEVATVVDDLAGTFRSCLLHADGTHLELIEPLDGQGSIAKFLENKGGGLHHVSLLVQDLDAELRVLKAKGVQLVDEEIKQVGHLRATFVHPASLQGILVELIEKTNQTVGN